MARWPAALAATVLVAVSAAATAAASDPFRGTWSTIDIDGSRMTVSFTGKGGSRSFTLVDDRATVCGGDPQVVSGTGAVSGDRIDVEAIARCAGASDGEPFAVTYFHDAELRSLFDGTLAWRRGFAGPEAFIGAWFATDVDGSAMTLTFGGRGLTRSVTLFDDLATGACEPDAPIALSGRGLIGSVLGDGRFIAIDISGRCGRSGALVSASSKFEYDVWSNTLIGPLQPLELGGEPTQWTVTWQR